MASGAADLKSASSGSAGVVLLAARTAVRHLHRRLATEQPDGQLLVRAAALADVFALDLRPEMDGWKTSRTSHAVSLPPSRHAFIAYNREARAPGIALMD
jgi:hypothetical protein